MHFLKPKSKKNNTIPKIIWLIIAIFVSVTSMAQAVKISISGQNITIKQAFEQIEAQSNYTVAYSIARFDAQKKITVNLKNVSLKEALTFIFKDTGFTCKINGLHIIVVRETSKSSPDTTPAGSPRQTIRGVVRDAASGLPVTFANIAW